MLLTYDYFQTMSYALVYMTIYNLTSFLLFTTILQLVNMNLKSLYTFSDLDASNFLTKILSLSVLSLAGVPPLVGFFSKIFVLVLILSSNFFVLYFPLFVLLFIGLYFYVQNLRFLSANNTSDMSQPQELSLRVNMLYFTLTLPLTFIVFFGFCYIDDFIILATWVLI
jgi:NADH:ubiquinone oxidoreductase subunit 2 (subunit N)